MCRLLNLLVDTAKHPTVLVSSVETDIAKVCNLREGNIFEEVTQQHGGHASSLFGLLSDSNNSKVLELDVLTCAYVRGLTAVKVIFLWGIK